MHTASDQITRVQTPRLCVTLCFLSHWVRIATLNKEGPQSTNSSRRTKQVIRESEMILNAASENRILSQ